MSFKATSPETAPHQGGTAPWTIKHTRTFMDLVMRNAWDNRNALINHPDLADVNEREGIRIEGALLELFDGLRQTYGNLGPEPEDEESRSYSIHPQGVTREQHATKSDSPSSGNTTPEVKVTDEEMHTSQASSFPKTSASFKSHFLPDHQGMPDTSKSGSSRSIASPSQPRVGTIAYKKDPKPYTEPGSPSRSRGTKRKADDDQLPSVKCRKAKSATHEELTRRSEAMRTAPKAEKRARSPEFAQSRANLSQKLKVMHQMDRMGRSLQASYPWGRGTDDQTCDDRQSSPVPLALNLSHAELIAIGTLTSFRRVLTQ